MECHRGIGRSCVVQDAFEAIRKASSHALLFIDPPYRQTRATGQYTAGDFTMANHRQLAKALESKRASEKSVAICAGIFMQHQMKRKEIIARGKP